MQFKLHNAHRFYVLEFYDFYEFEDEESYKRRLNFYDPVSGKEVLEWFTVAAEGEVALDCMLNALEEESIDLSITL